jgi:hypothetical protein
MQNLDPLACVTHSLVDYVTCGLQKIDFSWQPRVNSHFFLILIT